MKILVATGNPHKLEEIQAIFDACRQEARQTTDADASVDVNIGQEATDRDDEIGIDDLPITLCTLSDVPDGDAIAEPVEDQLTFEGNAVLKARHYARATNMWTLADDSGLEVDALGGEPGVRSARYAGAAGPRADIDLANNRLLLERLGGTPADYRTARFVCAMALVSPTPLLENSIFKGALPADIEADDILALVRGTVEGRILLPEEAADPTQPQRGRGRNGFGYDPLFLVPELGQTTAELPPNEKNRRSHRGNASRLMWQRLMQLRAYL